MTEKELLQRTKDFALRVIKLVNALPNNPAGRTIRRAIDQVGYVGFVKLSCLLPWTVES